MHMIWNLTSSFHLFLYQTFYITYYFQPKIHIRKICIHFFVCLSNISNNSLPAQAFALVVWVSRLVQAILWLFGYFEFLINPDELLWYNHVEKHIILADKLSDCTISKVIIQFKSKLKNILGDCRYKNVANTK